MPLKTTSELVQSMIDFFSKSTANVLDLNEPYPRWQAPADLKNDVFEKTAEANYRKEISKKKAEQDAEKMVNLGNDYYFALMVKKAHRLYDRSRIEEVAMNKSLEKGLADTDNGFLEKKYKQLGDKADPNDV